MARFMGIDVRPRHVRVAVLETTYRRTNLIDLREAAYGDGVPAELALAQCTDGLLEHVEALAVAIDGERSFIHRLKLPAAALKQLDEVVPYEIEAQVPIDIEELVYDHRRLKTRGEGTEILLLAAAARTAHVQERIELLRRVVGREPDRVGCGALPLGNLAGLSDKLAGPGPIAVLDLGGPKSELVLLSLGEPVFARTLSRGMDGLPESAPELVAEIRQTLAAWAAQGGDSIVALYLTGGGAQASGSEEYLAYQLDVPVERLTQLRLDNLIPEKSELVPRFAKALGLAAGLSGPGRDPNLRQGSLAYQRGYGFLKEKVPLLSGLAGAIFISFAFATWAELDALGTEQKRLATTLSELSQQVLGESTDDPERAMELLERAERREEADPQPKVDAFDVVMAISRAVSPDITHDIEEFDMNRDHVQVNGVVANATQAQSIAGALKENECFTEPKISKITQVVNSDRQKYVLEFDVKCPEEGAGAMKKTAEAGGP